MSLLKSRFIELIGNIQNPKYQLVELNEICEFIKDGTHQTPIYTEDRVNGFKFLSSKDVTSQKINWSNIKYIPKELHEQLYAKLSPKRGDILLAKNGTTGVAAVVDSDEIFDIYVSLALLRPKSGVNVSYLCSALNSEDLKRQFNSSLKGIGVPNLHLREIKKARIIFPPIDIQNKISSITKQIDKSKFLLQQILEKLELLKKSRFIEMFGQCNKEELIGNVVSICRGASPRPISEYITKDSEGINWIKIGDVSDDSLYITSAEEKITKEGASKSRLVHKGDFILSNSMSFGRPYILGIDGCVHDGWLILSKFSETFNEIFLYYALKSDYVQNQFRMKVNGATVKNLNSDLVKNTKIKVPPIEKQMEFSNFIEQIDKSKLIIQKALEDLVGKV